MRYSWSMRRWRRPATRPGAPRPAGWAVSETTQPEPDTVREWDRLVQSTPGSDVAQLSTWARIRQKAGFRPLYLLVRHDDRLAAGALVLRRRLPIVGEIAYASYGPVVSPEAPREQVVDHLVAALDTLAKTRLQALFLQPPVDGHDVSARLRERGFRSSESEIAPTASIRVDLRRDVEELRGGLSKTNRRRTRIWADRGVSVRLGSHDDVPLVAELMAQTAEHQQFKPLSLDYVRTLHRELDAGGHVAIFIAELDGTPVAARLCTLCDGVIKSRLAAIDRSERARKEGVAAATVWQAMLWGKANGYHTYDLGGIRSRAARLLLADQAELAENLSGADAFKTQFGGQAYLYQEQVEFISPLLRHAYDLSRRSSAGNRIIAAAKQALRGGRRW